MNSHEINKTLSLGDGTLDPLLPNWYALKSAKIRFPFEFGLAEIPKGPGLLVIRGARQYGKSTWLESEIVKSFKAFVSAIPSRVAVSADLI